MENRTTNQNPTHSNKSEIRSSNNSHKKTTDKMSEYIGAASEELKKMERIIKENVDKNPLLVLSGALISGYFAGYLMRRIAPPTSHNTSRFKH